MVTNSSLPTVLLRTPLEPPCKRHYNAWAKINTSMSRKNFRSMEQHPGKGVVDRGISDAPITTVRFPLCSVFSRLATEHHLGELS